MTMLDFRFFRLGIAVLLAFISMQAVSANAQWSHSLDTENGLPFAEFGCQPEDLQSIKLNFKSPDGLYEIYTGKSDGKVFERSIDSINYYFFRNRLRKIHIELPDDIDKEKFLEAIQSRYGKHTGGYTAGGYIGLSNYSGFTGDGYKWDEERVILTYAYGYYNAPKHRVAAFLQYESKPLNKDFIFWRETAKKIPEGKKYRVYR